MADGEHGAQKERSFEIGMDEAWKANMKLMFDFTLANMKRTYDEYQNESLESVRRNRTIVDKLVSDAQQFDNARQVIANQALQNSVETANLVGKQAVRDAALATDRQWNVDEQGYTAQQILGAPFVEAIKAAVAAAVADANPA